MPGFNNCLLHIGGLCEHVAVSKRLARVVIKVVAGIAVIVFIVARMTTNWIDSVRGFNRRPTRLLRPAEIVGKRR